MKVEKRVEEKAEACAADARVVVIYSATLGQTNVEHARERENEREKSPHKVIRHSYRRRRREEDL